MNYKTLISIASGGFLGGLCRYWLTVHWSNSGILLANLSGCFLLSFLTYYVIERGLLADWLNAGIGTGFIGAFTTFSSFATATITLGTKQLLFGMIYGAISSLGGLLMAGIGFLLAKHLGAKQNG